MAKSLFNEPANEDTLPFRVASGLAALERATSPELNLPDAGVDSEGFRAQLGNAMASLEQAGVAPEEVDYDTASVLGAAFRQGNTIGSALANEEFSTNVLFPGADQKQLSGDELLAKISADGMLPMLDAFSDVQNEAQYEARKANIEREVEDRKILASAGFRGVAASLAAGILDLPTLLPAARVVQLGRAATGSRVALNTAVASGIDAAATEVALHSTQATRTGEESAINIASSAVLGGILGFGVHSVLGRVAGDEAARRLDDLRADAATGFQGSRSAGAQALDLVEQLKARGLNGDSRVFNAGAFTILEKLGKLPGFLGANLRTPRLELEAGMSKAERSFIGQMTFNPSISVRQVEAAKMDSAAGFEAPRNVAGEIDKYQGQLTEAVYQIENLFKKNKANYKNLDAFLDDVTRALVGGDKSPDPVVQQAAKLARSHVLEPIRAAHVANGNFAE